MASLFAEDRPTPTNKNDVIHVHENQMRLEHPRGCAGAPCFCKINYNWINIG